MAVVVGTSTSSIGETEEAYAQLGASGRFPAHMSRQEVHTPHSIGAFVRDALGLEGPCLTVSTACSSSAKVFAVTERLLRLGLVDAAVVGGADTLCGSVMFGFNSLQLVSPEPCRPFDAERCGINLGEAAGFALLERAPGGLQLLGHGEVSDAHHMSAPHPHGLGAERALDDALARAGVDAQAIDHINLHGTASTKNDEVEAALVARRFTACTHASSTKGFTGHTLGAAGIVGAAFSLLAIETGWIAGTVNTNVLDPLCGPQIRLQPARDDVRPALSHWFASAARTACWCSAEGLPRPPVRRRDDAALHRWRDDVGAGLARSAFRGDVGGEGAPADPPVRRRAPDSVVLALEVAAQAVAQSGHRAVDLASVFSSAHGDLALTDSLCSALANTPTRVSPTKFLNSVHNADSGYWTQATGCRQASVAISAFRHSFAAGLLEACVQCAAEARPMLRVACDIEACGALACNTESRGLLGFALVLSPVPGARSVAALAWSLASGPTAPWPLHSAAAQALADGLPLFEALALERQAALRLPLSATLAIDLRLHGQGANLGT